MRWMRVTVHFLIVLMAVVPLYNYLETESEAAVGIPTGYRSNLLLTSQVPRPVLDRIAQFDQLVITPYVVQPREDIWSICHRYNLKNFAFTIRSSNDLDESPAAGTILKIPNRVGTLFEVSKAQSLHEIATGFEVG